MAEWWNLIWWRKENWTLFSIFRTKRLSWFNSRTIQKQRKKIRWRSFSRWWN